MRVAVLAAAMSLGMTAAGAASNKPDLPLLPMPASVTAQARTFSFEHARIAASDSGERAAGERLRALLARGGQPKLPFARGGSMRFRRNRLIDPQGYRLIVTQRSVEISASSDAGLFYGAETLSQLMTA